MRRLLIATIGAVAIVAPASSAAAARWRTGEGRITIQQSERVARTYAHLIAFAKPMITCRERDHVCVIKQVLKGGHWAGWTLVYWVYTWRWANRINGHSGLWRRTVTLRVRRPRARPDRVRNG